jgi:UDP-glucose 4-epimerase
MSSTPRIFLTGATGLVGTELSRALASKFSSINAIYRHRKLPFNNIHWINFDASSTEVDQLDDVLKETDIIIHNAGCLKSGNTPEEIEEIDNVNVKFTKKLLEKAVEFRVKKIIYTSSLSVIKKPLPASITESSPSEPRSAYARSKYAAEQLITTYAEKAGMKYTILRISSPVSLTLEAMPDTVVKKWINLSREKKTLQVYGSGQRTQDFVSVPDVAQAVLNSIDKIEVSGIFNIASGSQISMLELAQMITKKFNTGYEFYGKDENEDDRWSISIEKAAEQLKYKPRFTSAEVIRGLLNNISS